MWFSENWKDYELLDTSDGERLERWGNLILIRPDPQIIWKDARKHPAWKKADGIYRRSHSGGGAWGVIGTFDGKAAQMKSGWIDEIVACNHTFEEVSRVEATCTKAGSISLICSTCNLKTATEAIEALGHTTDNGICGNCGEEIGGNTPVFTEVTKNISFASKANRVSQTTSQQVWKQNGITVTNNKGKSTSNVADYANPARFYKNSDIIIEAPGAITTIVFNCNSSSYATACKNSIGTVAGATVTISGSKVTITFTEAVESFKFAATNAQIRMNSIDVTYLSAE